jgi:hypothetical protein
MIILASIVIISGCTEEQKITELKIPGHGNQVYVFSNDIREVLKVPVSDPIEIQQLVWQSDRLNIIFNGSSQQDNAYFQVVAVNIVFKLQTFFAYEGKILQFPVFYYENDNWFNSTGDKLTVLNLEGANLWLLGPDTGAKSTSLYSLDNIIYLQGTDYKNLTLAGDKFALIVMGVDSI